MTLHKDDYEAIYGWIILIVTIIFLTVVWWTYLYNANEKRLNDNVYRESCIVTNRQNIIDYNLKCISSLKVEENAYIANNCYSQAKELYCSFNN